MKLLYLYFTYKEGYKRIFKDGIELNFDSQTRFHLQGDALVKVPSKGDLPKNFFSVLQGATTKEGASVSVVESVSVVAGANGVGKTSLAEVLKDIQEDTTQLSPFERYVVVYQLSNEMTCRCDSNIENLTVPQGVNKIDRHRIDCFPGNSIREVPLIYVSPHFTPYPLVRPAHVNSFVDLSTIGVMSKAKEEYNNPDAGLFRQVLAQDGVQIYKHVQTKYMLSFVSAANDLPHEFKIPPESRCLNSDVWKPCCEPAGIRISISQVAFAKRDVFARKRQNDNAIPEEAGKILQQIRPLGRSRRKNQRPVYDAVLGQVHPLDKFLLGFGFLTNAFYAYAGLYMIDNAQALGMDPKYKLDEYAKMLQEQCNDQKDFTAKEIDDFFGEALQRLKSIGHEVKQVENAKKCFAKLAEVLALIPDGDIPNMIPVGQCDSTRVVCRKHNQNYLERVLELVELHFLGKSILDFLDFDTDPRMSAGERSFFDTWGRLYHHFRESVDFTNCYKFKGPDFDISNSGTWPKPRSSDVMIFFDEAETTMHPDWQRRIVRMAIWFFEAFVPWMRPHIIFATHSPILLSDIPMGNVVLLDKDKKENDKTVVVTDKETKTFAANIFDLYRDSFFMFSGTVGAFARTKLDALVKKISDVVRRKKSEKIVLEEWRVAGLVGDPQVRKYFESVKPLVEEAQGEKLS